MYNSMYSLWQLLEVDGATMSRRAEAFLSGGGLGTLPPQFHGNQNRGCILRCTTSILDERRGLT
jgi:hypothetical protein